MLKKVPLTKRLTSWFLPLVGFTPFESSGARVVPSGDIESAFSRFGVQVYVHSVHPGASITTYAIRPLGKATIKQIAARVADVALCLSIGGIRFVDSIGELGCVGLEIPNKIRDYPRLENHPCLTPGVENDGVNVFLGTDSLNVAQAISIVDCPHTLVAGTTGSGKSVFLNAILCSIMRVRTPNQVGLVLIDPKQVEFNPYHDIPFLRTPVVTDMNKAFDAIKMLVGEMENRYSILKSAGCQNYSEFIERNPYSLLCPGRIICMIDEFADLILTNKKVEEPIVRLAQKGRAAGIHLVLATQRPVVKVVTGLIKANIPVRIAFRVSSNLESRIILDQGGAESLMGKGDMIMVHPDLHSPVRLQAPWVPPEEVASLTAHWRTQSFFRNMIYGEAA